MHHTPSTSVVLYSLKPIRLNPQKEQKQCGKRQRETEVVGPTMSFSYFRIPLWGLLITNYFLEGEATSCPKGWLSYVSNCYGLFPDKLTREEAEEECRSLGHSSHLASILSDTEKAVVINYITTSFQGVGNVWIGLKDRSKIRKWKWEDKSDTKGFYWTAGAPKLLTTSKYCVYMVDSEGYKTWKDTKCSEQYAFLCKMKA